MRVAVIDNDALIKLFEDQYFRDKSLPQKILNVLLSMFDAIWVPKTIAAEFEHESYGGRRTSKKVKKRQRKIVSHLTRVSNNLFTNCPVPVSKREIELALCPGVDAGEADAITQAKKTLASDKHVRVSEICFLSDDADALAFAQRQNVDNMPLKEVREMLLQVGIVITR